MNTTVPEHLSEDEYYDLLYREHKENKANALALFDKKDFKIKKIKI